MLLKSIFWLILLGILQFCYCTIPGESPCPKVLTYEDIGASDEYDAKIVLQSDMELIGVWLTLEFDRPTVLEIGNWLGEVVILNTTRFLIRNTDRIIKPTQAQAEHFIVRYDPTLIAPKLTKIYLNGRIVCSYLDAVIATVFRPRGRNPGFPSSWIPDVTSTTLSPIGGQNEANNVLGIGFRSQGDYFPGDFAAFDESTNLLEVPDICGTVVKPPKALITYGQQTDEGEFPWHAALYRSEKGRLLYSCGASLITIRHLITVAHCVTTGRGTTETISTDRLVIYLGKYYLDSFKSPGLQTYSPEFIKVHEDYYSPELKNDLAIIKLSSDVRITNYVRPVCIWGGDTSVEEIAGKQGTVIGWGFDHTRQLNNILTKTEMPVVPLTTCIYSNPDFFARFTSEKTFCAGFRNGTLVCEGDSGGGMVLPKPNSNPMNPVWQLRGLVSLAKGFQSSCDTHHFAVFTDIAKYLGWIRHTLKL
ncbi:unnamed protein product [Acanthoscelides obtectus]|uniref:Peptidase S1 domain-containing protein n=1 Tax=Acanthoscelides obtectus TaxID=200917 RepID=A0A9P0PNT1_ACAOB|nr:unnamed protein product [Acanthoscelides obtectus]CAK1662711.1 Serine protease gd [Acanthoscelides obtectus]